VAVPLSGDVCFLLALELTDRLGCVTVNYVFLYIYIFT